MNKLILLEKYIFSVKLSESCLQWADQRVKLIIILYVTRKFIKEFDFPSNNCKELLLNPTERATDVESELSLASGWQDFLFLKNMFYFTTLDMHYAAQHTQVGRNGGRKSITVIKWEQHTHL